MAKGLFMVGFTVPEIKVIQKKAKTALMEGKTVMSWSDGGTSVSKQFIMPVSEILEECAYALRRLEPATTPGSPQTSFVGNRLPH